MDKNNTPAKGFDTLQHNGLSDIQELHYARVLTREDKSEKDTEKKCKPKVIIYIDGLLERSEKEAFL